MAKNTFRMLLDLLGSNLTRLLVRARVTSLEVVLQFFVFSVAEGFHGVSCIVQCEIIQHNILRAQHEDKEEVLRYPHI